MVTGAIVAVDPLHVDDARTAGIDPYAVVVVMALGPHRRCGRDGR